MSADTDKARAYRKWFRLPANESLIGDFSCAISKKILIHGRLFVSAHFICFYSNIFGSETKVVIRVQDVLAVRPASLISIIPNSIEVDTVTSPNEPYLFTSFLSRDEVLSILESIVTRAKSSPTPLLSPAPTSAAPSTPITAQSPNHTAASASESKSEQKASMVRRLSSLMNPLNWNQNSPSDRLKSPQTPPLTPTSFNSAFHSPSPGDQRRKSTDMSVSPSTPAEHRPRSASAALPMSASTPIRVVEPVALEYQQSLPLDPSPPIPSIAAELHDSDLEELFCTDVVGITPHAIYQLCFAEDAPASTHLFHATVGCSEFRVSHWLRNGTRFDPASTAVLEHRAEAVKPLLRSFLFRSPVAGSPVGPDSTRLHKLQCLQWLSVDTHVQAKRLSAIKPSSFSSHYSPSHPHLLVVDSYVSVDVPYGDHFSITDCMEMFALPQRDPAAPPVTRVRISMVIRFNKFTMLKPVIRNMALRDVKTAQQQWLKLLTDYMSTHPDRVHSLLAQSADTSVHHAAVHAAEHVEPASAVQAESTTSSSHKSSFKLSLSLVSLLVVLIAVVVAFCWPRVDTSADLLSRRVQQLEHDVDLIVSQLKQGESLSENCSRSLRAVITRLQQQL